MTNKKGSVNANAASVFHGPCKRFFAIMITIAASILFYGFTPSADVDSPLTSVTIVDGENYFEVETKGQTVGDALKAADIQLGENDVVSKSIEESLSDGEIITVKRSRLMYLETSGNIYEVFTNQDTVGAALLSDGFQVGKYDEVIPDVNTPVEDGMTVSVTRVYVNVYEITETIPFRVETVENPNLKKNFRVVSRKGKNGSILRTYKKVSKDGAGVTATLIGEETIEEPVAQLEEIGTMDDSSVAPSTPSQQPSATPSTSPSPDVAPSNGKLTPGTTPDGIPLHAIPTIAQSNTVTVIDGNTAITASGTFTFSKRIPCTATAYDDSAQSQGKWAGQTATGRKPAYGVIAVDPKVIPLNSKLYIESADGGQSWVYGFAVAGDTGGAIKGNKVDLFYNTREQCYNFGRRDCIVYILD